MFWAGVAVGLFVGANVGVVVAALLIGIKREERYGYVEEFGDTG